jgi:hypothetical protein
MQQLWELRTKILIKYQNLTLIEVVLCLLLSPSSGTIGAKNMIEVLCLSLLECPSKGFPCYVEVR